MDEMDPRIFEMLKSRDPEDRKKAVKALAQIHSNESLRYLATIHQKDPDPGVRDLAIKAGRHVRKSRAAGHWTGDTGETEAVADTPQPTSNVSAINQEQAKGLMDTALDAVMAGNYEQAEDMARQAFRLSPDLQYDTYYTGVASEIMGMEGEEAVAALLGGGSE